MDIRKPIEVKEAVSRVMQFASLGKREEIDFHVCDGRRLAAPIMATNDVPSFHKSPYDGFALRSVDTVEASSENPIKFKVLETIGAGELSKKQLAPFEAIRIMTGAELPEGADCIIMFEQTGMFESQGQAFMEIYAPIPKDHNVMKKGSEVQEGEEVVSEGSLITPGVKAVLATFGYRKVMVSKQPIVGVLATGTELLEIDEPLEKGKIRNSNGYMVCSQIERAGAEYKYYGKLPDVLEESYQKVKNILDEVDILITTGGVSVGDFDLIPDIYKKLNAKLLFNKIAQRPGSVTSVAVKDETLLFGLSGNPSACYVGFELYVRPVIQTALHNKTPFLQRTKAQLMDDFPKPSSFTRFVRGYYRFGSNGLEVYLAGQDKSNVVTSLAHSTCFIELPGGSEGYQKGDFVNIILTDHIQGATEF
ncbi:MAG TPA: molybdopterin molybdotransferase MoeA [Candidatus Avamphibacillus intestinigallinarum]|nr:molybdopterin molybdotransferase MoeA [Candidatus Avamphibacillus intestinigallinarum]